MPIPFLAEGLTGLASLLLNRLGAGSQYSRMRDLQRQIFDLLSSKALTGEANNIFAGIRGSPFYSNVQANQLSASNTLSNNLARSFALKGLSTTGIAGVAQPLARSSFSTAMGGIDSDLFQKSLSLARENLGARADFLAKQGGLPSISGLTVGGTLNDLGPLIYHLLSNYGSDPIKNWISNAQQPNVAAGDWTRPDLTLR